MEISRPSFRPLRALSHPHLFSPFTLETDSVEWRELPSCFLTQPLKTMVSPLHLPAGLLPRGSFSLATTCSLGRRVWIASPWGSTGQ